MKQPLQKQIESGFDLFLQFKIAAFQQKCFFNVRKKFLNKNFSPSSACLCGDQETIIMCQNGRVLCRELQNPRISRAGRDPQGPSSPAPGPAQVYQDASPWVLWNVVKQLRQFPFAGLSGAP